MIASSLKPFGFSKQDRLKRNADFQRVFETGRRIRGKRITICAVENGTERSRLGLAVGKKVGHSVKRNRIRRVLREAFRLNRHALSAGFDLVLIAVGNWEDCSLPDVEVEMVGLFERLVSRPKK